MINEGSLFVAESSALIIRVAIMNGEISSRSKKAKRYLCIQLINH